MTREEHLIKLDLCVRNREPFDFFGNQVYVIGWECNHTQFDTKYLFKLSDGSKFEVTI